MRKLTAAQLDRVYTQVQGDGLTHGSIEDLDDLWLDGRFSLLELRRLVEALTLCERSDGPMRHLSPAQLDAVYTHVWPDLNPGPDIRWLDLANLDALRLDVTMSLERLAQLVEALTVYATQ